MMAQPNETVLEGTVEAVRPQADGWGAEVDFKVNRNVSQGDAKDFLQPRPGRVMTLFATASNIAVGQSLRVQTRLLAGPFGERAVIERAELIN